jgi:cytoskeleton protein RodZ
MSGEVGNPYTGLKIGKTLRLAREKRGLSLHHVEDVTKIRARYLRDLENENFDVLPAVYVLGSLKTYAEHLGLDGAAMTAELKRRQQPPQAEGDEASEDPPSREPRGFLTSLGRLFGIGETVEDEAGTVAGPVRGTGLHVSLAVVLVFVFATYLAPGFETEGQPSVSQVREPTVSQTPSMLAQGSDVLVDKPYTAGGNVDYQSEEQAHIRLREAARDDIAEAVADEQVRHLPQTAQAPSSQASSFESGPANASASAAASAPTKTPANASPTSTVSPPTPAPTRIRTEPVAQEAPDEGGEVAAAPASPPARVSGSPSTHETQAYTVDAPPGNGIYRQDPQLGEEVQRIHIVTSQETSQSSSIRERQVYQH